MANPAIFQASWFKDAFNASKLKCSRNTGPYAPPGVIVSCRGVITTKSIWGIPPFGNGYIYGDGGNGSTTRRYRNYTMALPSGASASGTIDEPWGTPIVLGRYPSATDGWNGWAWWPYEETNIPGYQSSRSIQLASSSPLSRSWQYAYTPNGGGVPEEMKYLVETISNPVDDAAGLVIAKATAYSSAFPNWPPLYGGVNNTVRFFKYNEWSLFAQGSPNPFRGFALPYPMPTFDGAPYISAEPGVQTGDLVSGWNISMYDGFSPPGDVAVSAFRSQIRYGHGMPFALVKYIYGPGDANAGHPKNGVLYQLTQMQLSIPGVEYDIPFPPEVPLADCSIVSAFIKHYYSYGGQADLEAYCASQGWTLIKAFGTSNSLGSTADDSGSTAD